MNIQILSDIHLEFEDFEIDVSNADVLVLAGDIHIGDKGLQWALDNVRQIPVIYVLGNHEYYKHVYPKLTHKLRVLSQNTNIHLLEDDFVQIDNVTFYGSTLWTDFELYGDPRIAGYQCQQVMTDFKKIRKEPSYSKLRSVDVAMINKKSVRWLESEVKSKTRKSVVVTHHSPSAQSIPRQYENDILSASYASNLDNLVRELEPDLWVHGHMHETCDYLIGKTRVVCNPRGYPDERNPQFDPTFIVSV